MGITLSVMATIRLYRFRRTRRRIVPNAGPINGNQKRTTTRSGLSLRNRLPVRIQLKGLMELMTVWMVKPAGAGSSVYCVFPGKGKEDIGKKNKWSSYGPVAGTPAPAADRNSQPSPQGMRRTYDNHLAITARFFFYQVSIAVRCIPGHQFSQEAGQEKLHPDDQGS